MFTFFVFLFVLSVLIIVHEFGHFIVAKKIGVQVERFSLGFGPILWSTKKKGTQYTICAIPLGGYVKMSGDNLEEYKGKHDEYFSKTPFQRAAIVFCGPLLNYVLGFLCFWFIFVVGYPALTCKVGGLVDGFGAKDAGIKAQDIITAVDDSRVASWDELQKIIQTKKPSSVVKLSILRDARPQIVDVTIKEQQFDDIFGKKQSVGLLGIAPEYNDFITVKHGFFKSFTLSFEKTWGITTLTLKSLWRMVTGKMSMRDSVTGPLGIFVITSKVAKQGFTALLNLVGLLSVSLGLFNLLPLPILDGGHIVLLGIEKLRGKYLSSKAERIITQVGFVFIISLVLVVTYNDLLKYGGKFIPWLK